MSSSHYSRPKATSSPCFSIDHYAGRVKYDSKGFLEKNRDRLPAEVINLLRASDNNVVRLLFQTPLTKTGILTIFVSCMFHVTSAFMHCILIQEVWQGYGQTLISTNAAKYTTILTFPSIVFSSLSLGIFGTVGLSLSLSRENKFNNNLTNVSVCFTFSRKFVFRKNGASRVFIDSSKWYS